MHCCACDTPMRVAMCYFGRLNVTVMLASPITLPPLPKIDTVPVALIVSATEIESRSRPATGVGALEKAVFSALICSAIAAFTTSGFTSETRPSASPGANAARAAIAVLPLDLPASRACFLEPDVRCVAETV